MTKTSHLKRLAAQCLMALVAPALVACVMQLSWPFFKDNPVAPFLLAAVFCSWYGGPAPGLLSLVISFLTADYFFIEPYFHLWLPSQTNVVRLVIFAAVGLFICVMSELMHRERRRAAVNLEAATSAEENLRHSEQHLQRVLNNLFAFVAVLLPDGTLVEANRKALEVAEISLASVEGRKFWDCYWWSYDTLVQERVHEAFEYSSTGKIARFDVGLYIAGGQLMSVDFMLAPMCNDDGKITHLIASAIDITDRKQAEAALRESEYQMRAILDTEPECVKLLAADCSLIDMNPAGLAMIQADSLSQVRGKNLCEMALPEHRPKFNEVNRRVFLGESATLEFEITGIKGTRCWLEMHTAPFRDKHGAIIAALGITRDVTERHKTEEALRENMAKLQAIFFTSPMGLGLAANRVLLEANEFMCRMLGYTRAELIGQEAGFIYPTVEEYERSGREYQQMAGGNRGSIETRYLCKDGRIIDVAVTAALVNPDRAAEGVVFAVMDITDRKKAEAALRASEASYRALFEHAPDGIVVSNPEGYYVDANPSICRMLGYERADLIGMLAADVVALAEFVHVSGALKGPNAKSQYQREWQVRREDGSVLAAELVGTTMPDGNILGMIREITERKLAETAMRTKNEELAAMTQQLWQASKLTTMGELAASIAHELNNPLTTITLCVEALIAGTAGDAQPGAMLETVRCESERMSSLISNLLQFSRRSHAQIATLNLAEEVSNSLNLVDYHLRSRNIVVVLDFAEDLLTVQGDSQQMLQVFINLLTNASDAMPDGGTLTLRLRNGLLNEQPALMIECEDTGTGIEAADVQHIWEPFFTTKPEGKGTGLGLPICRRSIEAHGGTIEIESWSGQGATIRILLPATAARES